MDYGRISVEGSAWRAEFWGSMCLELKGIEIVKILIMHLISFCYIWKGQESSDGKITMKWYP